MAARKPTNEMAVVAFQPQIAAAIAPPPHEPARPIVTVSHTGIGSGPGTARRASAPVTKPSTMIAMTELSTRGKSRPKPRLVAAPWSRAARTRAVDLRVEVAGYPQLVLFSGHARAFPDRPGGSGAPPRSGSGARARRQDVVRRQRRTGLVSRRCAYRLHLLSAWPPRRDLRDAAGWDRPAGPHQQSGLRRPFRVVA